MACGTKGSLSFLGCETCGITDKPTYMNPSSPIIDELRNRFDETVLMAQPTCDGIPTLWCTVEGAPDMLRYLKNQIDRPYRMLYDLTGIDERWRAHRPDQPKSDFSIVYHLLSFERNEDIRIKVPLKGEYPRLASITDIWASADWYEREVWDMFGVTFDGHPHLRRILLPATWEGHPLRKEHPARATEMGPFQLPVDKQLRE